MKTLVAGSLTCVLLLSITGCDGEGRRTNSGAVEVGWCSIGGCSGELCGNGSGGVSTCEWKDEYACFRTAICAPQVYGGCGWTQTPELMSCLENGAPVAGPGACSADSDCSGGEVCESCPGVNGGRSACTPGCHHDSQCPAGQQCRVVECVSCPCPGQCS